MCALACPSYIICCFLFNFILFSCCFVLNFWIIWTSVGFVWNAWKMLNIACNKWKLQTRNCWRPQKRKHFILQWEPLARWMLYVWYWEPLPKHREAVSRITVITCWLSRKSLTFFIQYWGFFVAVFPNLVYAKERGDSLSS